MNTKKKLKCRNVKAVLRYYVTNRHKYPEKYAHHLLFLFNPFRNEENLKSGNSGKFSEKVQEPGIIDIVNRNKHIFEPYGDLVDSALLNVRTSHNPDAFLQQENDEVEEQLINTANDLESENPNNDAVILDDIHAVPTNTPACDI